MEYLLKVQNVYRVENEAAALRLREKLREETNGDLIAFSYTVKEIKQKGEVIETYLVCKATLDFTPEKEPERHVIASYEED